MEYLRFHLGDNDEQLHQFVGCYQAVFATPPWNETWVADAVEADLRHELSLTGATCWLALDGDRIVGFCYGYPLAVDWLDEHLKLDGCAAALAGQTQIAYQDDMGVVLEYRGQHIASELFRRRNADFLAQGLTVGVVRTMTKPPSVTYEWYTALGYEVIAEYGDERGRVIMARSITDFT